MRKTLLFGLFTLFSLFSYAQNSATIDSLIRVLPATRDTSRIKTLLTICWELRFQNADSARQYGTQALELARDAEYDNLIVEALHYLGITHQAQGNYSEALALESEALELRYKLGNDLKTATTLNNIGIIHDEKGDYKTALEFYFKALPIFQRLNDPGKIALVLTNIGIVQKGLGNYAKAITFYRESLPIYEKLNDKFGLAASHTNLGSVYLYVPRYDSALYYSELAYQEFKDQKLTQFEPIALANAGIALSHLGRTTEALDYLNRSLEQYRVYDNKKEMAFNLIFMSQMALEQKEVSKALAYAREGVDLARKIEALEQIKEGSLALSKALAADGNYQAAYTEYQHYVAAKDTLFQKDKVKEMLNLQATYERDKKVVLLQKQNELKDSQLQLSIAISTGLGLVIVLGAVLLWMWRTRLKLKQRVELESTRAALRQSQLGAVIASQEAERKRFAADLHDGLGQYISAMRLGLASQQESRKHLESILQQMNQEIREIAFNLMPQVLLKLSLTDALKEFAGRISKSGLINVEVMSFEVQPLQQEHAVAIYRICQEWVNNILKYNSATSILIQLVQDETELTVTIEDNGVGFDRKILEQSTGNGWRNIQSRLDLIDGTFELDTELGRDGTTVILNIPVRGFAQNSAA